MSSAKLAAILSKGDVLSCQYRVSWYPNVIYSRIKSIELQ